MQNFLLIVENHYKTSASSTNSTMSLIKLRLDISNFLSTSKSLGAKHQGFFVDSPTTTCFWKGWKQKSP